MTERNPLPNMERKPVSKGCPKCGHDNYDGRCIQGGVIRKTCLKCGFKWEGGLGQVPDDPLHPMPPDPYVPPVQFVGIRAKDGALTGVEEIDRKVDTTQYFRKGAPIPEDGED